MMLREKKGTDSFFGIEPRFALLSGLNPSPNDGRHLIDAAPVTRELATL